MSTKQQISQAEKIYSNATKSMVAANYSEKSVEDMFQAEMFLDDAMHTANKFCGMTLNQKNEAMKAEYDEIAAENDIYDYYND